MHLPGSYATIVGVRRLPCALCLLVAGCLASGPARGPTVLPASTAALEDSIAAWYATDPAGTGVLGGAWAEALARAVAEGLRSRGDEPRALSTLARLGGWYFGEISAGRHPTSAQSERAAERLGFLGQLHAASVFPLGAEVPGAWPDVLAQLPRNAIVNRYGVWLSPEGQTAVVVFAAVELTLEPFAREPRPGEVLRLRGAIGRRFARGEVYLTPPAGAVTRTALAGRDLDVSLPLSSTGIYRVEVMGDGPSGPVVLANAPVYVGVDEPRADDAAAGAGATGAGAAERMFALLNGARRDAGLAPLVFDPQLATIARAYCDEMVRGHFFGHVSPTTGTVADRVRRAGIAASMVGENVSQGESPEAAHQGLMDSPGHRANMLDPRFTHVGVGVVATNAEPPLVATLVFLRRSDPSRLTAADVTAAIASLRARRRVPPAATDPVLTAAAEAGTRAFASGAAGSKGQAMDLAEAALVREDRRRGVVRSKACAEWLEIYELADLEDVALLSNPAVKGVGLGVAWRADTAPAGLAVLVLADGAGCK